jgi:hypothetical protein
VRVARQAVEANVLASIQEEIARRLAQPAPAQA